MQVNVTETVYRNYQKITLQESPGSVQAGRLPRHREVVLLHDLIDCARPGEEIQVTGDQHKFYPILGHLYSFNWLRSAAMQLVDDSYHQAKLRMSFKMQPTLCRGVHKHLRRNAEREEWLPGVLHPG